MMGRVNQEMSSIRDLTNAREAVDQHERGLNAMSKQEIEAITTFKYSEYSKPDPKLKDKVCSICLLDVTERPPASEARSDNYKNYGKLCELKCGHIFHASCVLDGWLTK